jgi:hypothetical protein
MGMLLQLAKKPALLELHIEALESAVNRLIRLNGNVNQILIASGKKYYPTFQPYFASERCSTRSRPSLQGSPERFESGLRGPLCGLPNLGLFRSTHCLRASKGQSIWAKTFLQEGPCLLLGALEAVVILSLR